MRPNVRCECEFIEINLVWFSLNHNCQRKVSIRCEETFVAANGLRLLNWKLNLWPEQLRIVSESVLDRVAFRPMMKLDSPCFFVFDGVLYDCVAGISISCTLRCRVRVV